ncbi:MAG: hypothetical protein CSA58_05360 [Micrococcales bacterium]|nr:MAG: hypothetical protein CSB46_04460 [Micrococcales bacterium]PIE27213.1 MAG: hypothetical protein CSA58_05360 [Micrococcales bacterium]
MLRSLFTGISGLKSHQTMMDVTGNNIANVNTNGYKSSSSQFQDTLSQLLNAASAPVGAGRGGTNPAQVGLGVKLAGITTNFGQGSTQMTGRSLDMLINGDGFFTVQNGNQEMYTRAGSFSLDRDGNVVTLQGDKVRGYAPGAAAGDPLTDLQIVLDDPTNGKLESFTIGPDGVITGVYANGTRQEVGTLAIARFANPAGLEKAGNSLYRVSANSGVAGTNPETGKPGEPGFGTITTGALEMSNVDLATEFTNMIISQRGFQANSKIISTSDEILQELVNMKR